ncbi:hypothetical protein B0I35DRAFT_442125 [Stachybotrys elegans]|uniref:Protein kinase domain-containing protein n=1 Tax=Stachybotrys elegans TaxID=80388 RepID=A0A8K0WLT9_9HYPO|nr:hypothetical protein B0I35DRAFT_442125 [Stachybotrys elegans]
MAAEDHGLPPAWTMLDFTFHVEHTDATLVTLYEGHRIVAHLLADNFSQSPTLKEKYLFFLQVADEYELDGYTVEDFYDWIAEPLLPIFKLLGASTNSLDTLEGFFYPETHSYDIKADGDALVAVPRGGAEPALFGIHVAEDLCSPWPCFRPSEIRPCKEAIGPNPPSPIPSKVILEDGRYAYLKLINPGDRGFLLHELKTYGQIRDANLGTSLRISSLLGLVRDIDGKVLALLLRYIECEWQTLTCASGAADKHLRQKWAQEVEDTITQLHQSGIVWGDVKPDNVLVDVDDNAWIIDFGGSYTEDWVPRELQGTTEGDLAGLGKIKEFLETPEGMKQEDGASNDSYTMNT